MTTQSDKLRELAERAMERFNALPPDEQEAHRQAQRESWVRGMEPCEHGVLDFEQCSDCRSLASHQGSEQ